MNRMSRLTSRRIIPTHCIEASNLNLLKQVKLVAINMLSKKIFYIILPFCCILYLINEKPFAGYKYEVKTGVHCRGESITSWADGTNASYGVLSGISTCNNMCDVHVECAGFVHRTSDDICSLWKRGPLDVYNHAGHNCHKKIGSSYIIFVYMTSIILLIII